MSYNESRRLNVNSYKTVIHRKRPSSIAKIIIQGVSDGVFPKFDSALDWGCGIGQDVEYYRSLGLDADGYDIYKDFGWPNKPTKKYDLVTIIFVVNVLPSRKDRLAVLREASTFVRPGGHLIVAARSPQAIAKAASKANWQTFNDGYISHNEKGTFQKGISEDEIKSMINEVGLKPIISPLNSRNDASLAIGVK